MKIGTLSFGKKHEVFDLSDSDRVGTIVRYAVAKRLDFLACGGWSVASSSDVGTIARELERSSSSTGVLLETQFDHLPGDTSEEPYHVMYWIGSGGDISVLGKQFFAQSGELKGKSGGRLLSAFDKAIGSRSVVVGGKSLFALCCGELNLLNGRDNVTCRSDKAQAALDAADIVVNPTHDRMGNAGTLKAKRSYLSRKVSDRTRLAVSVSNWDHAEGRPSGKQNPNSPSLHTVFLNGECLLADFSEGGQEEGFMYREWTADV